MTLPASIINNTIADADELMANFQYLESGIAALQSGWIPAAETWTYASADSPTFTFTITGDYTTTYAVGQKIKLTQTTVKYFIITGVVFSSPNTIVTIYGGTDYALANAAISSPYFSCSKSPIGFPLDPTKWTVELSDTTQSLQASPAQNTWYNVGSKQLTIPIGAWKVSYSTSGYAARAAAGIINFFIGLSTANNTEGDQDMLSFSQVTSSATGSLDFSSAHYQEKTLVLSVKTTYYLNIKTNTTSVSNIGFLGFNASNYQKTFIRAVCAYL